MALLARFTGPNSGRAAAGKPAAAPSDAFADEDDAPCGGSDGAVAAADAVVPAPAYCTQCRTERVVVRLRLTQALCKTCSISVVSHRIIAGLAATTPGSCRVLVALSGGDASMALLHTLFQALDCGRSRRHASWAACAFVDMSPLLPFFAHPHDAGLLHEARRQVVRAAVARGFSIAVLLPETAFVDAVDTAAEAPSASAAVSAAALAAAPTATAGAGAEDSPAHYDGSIGSADSGRLPLPLIGAWLAGTPVDLPSASRPQKELPAVEESALDAAVEALEAQLAAARSSPAAAAAAARMHSLFSAARSLDARARLQTAVLERCLAATASASGASHVLLGETMDRAAVRLLQATVEGGGFTAPLGAAGLDARFAAPAPAPAAAPAAGPAFAAAEPAAPAASSAASTATATSTSASSASSRASSPALLPFRWYAARSAETERARERREGEALPQPDTARGGVLMCRPLADVESREAALLVHYAGVSAPCPPRMLTLAPPRSSVAAATAALLGGLQASFPNTVHNVTRTLRKAPPPPNAAAHALPTDAAAAAASAVGRDAYAAARAAPLCALCAQLLPARGSTQAVRNAEAAARLGLFGNAAVAASTPAGSPSAADGAAGSAAEAPAGAATGSLSVRLQQSFCHTCLLALREFSAAHASGGSIAPGASAAATSDADGAGATASAASGGAGSGASVSVSRRPAPLPASGAGAGAGAGTGAAAASSSSPLVSLIAALSGSLPSATVATLIQSMGSDPEAGAGSGGSRRPDAGPVALAAAADGSADGTIGAGAAAEGATVARSSGRVVTRADMRAQLRGFLLDRDDDE